MMPMMISKRKLNIVSSLASQIVTLACGIITPRVLLAAFGSEAYGIAVSITQFLAYISLLESGIGGVARGKLYEPLAKRDFVEVGSIFFAVKRFFLYVGCAFFLYSLVLGFAYHDLAHVALFSRTYIFFLVLVISLATMAKYMGGLAYLTLLVSDQKQYIVNGISIMITVSNTVAIVLLTRLHFDLIWVKLGSSLLFILRPLLYFYFCRKLYPLPKKPKEHAVLEQKWTGIGQHLSYFLHRNTDVVLLTLFSDIRLVAVYSVYSLIVNSIRSVAESFSGGMEAAFGELIAMRQEQELRRQFKRYSTLLSVVSFVLFSSTGILILPFVRLYTSGITDADYIRPAFALLLTLAEAINCIALPFSSLPVAANHLKQTRWGAYGEAIINITLSCILIHWNPLVGVVIGTVAASLFRAVFYLVYSVKHLLRLSPLSVLLRFLLLLLMMSAVMFGGMYLLQNVEIESYIRWAFYGILVMLLLSSPAALLLWHSLRSHKQPYSEKQ